MADNTGDFFMASPEMMWEPSLSDLNIPPLDLDGQLPSLESNLSSPGHSPRLMPTPLPVEDCRWFQGADLMATHADAAARHGRALSTSAIAPEINIDFAPPSRRQSPQRANGGFSQRSADLLQSPNLLPQDARRYGRSPSPARSIRSINRTRSFSTGSDHRDCILDFSNPALNPTTQTTARTQKHPATFQCTLCPKRFTRAYNLRSHLRTHTEERPFACTVCGKAFARQHDRKRHEGLHSGEKKFVCKGTLGDGSQWGCGRRFARVDAIGRHFRSEAGRVCIKPLIDEESAERYRAYRAYRAWLDEAPGITFPGPVDLPPIDRADNFLPQKLLAQYPALCDTEPDQIPSLEDLYGYQAPINDLTSPSRSSSFAGSSFGSTGHAGFGYERSVSRQVSDTSLNSMWSATSFSSQRGTRVTAGYECNQCGATFDVPSELRHHERNHMPKEQRPHACQHCGERFLYPKDVQRHIGRKHPHLQHSSPSLAPLLGRTPSAIGHQPGEFASMEPLPMTTPHTGDPLASAAKGSDELIYELFGHLASSSFWDGSPQNDPNPNVETSGAAEQDLNVEGAGPAIPRSKSAEILHLKNALDAAKRDATLWREERNFYVELLQEKLSPEDLGLSLKFVHREEIVSPVRRARGWLKGIGSLFKTRRKSQEENPSERSTNAAVVNSETSINAAVVTLDIQLAKLDVSGGDDGYHSSEESRRLRSKSPIRARWKEFEGWAGA